MRNGEPIHVCSRRWMHRDDDCHCPCSFCHLYSQPFILTESEAFHNEYRKLHNQPLDVDPVTLDMDGVEVPPTPVTDEDFAALPIVDLGAHLDGSGASGSMGE